MKLFKCFIFTAIIFSITHYAKASNTRSLAPMLANAMPAVVHLTIQKNPIWVQRQLRNHPDRNNPQIQKRASIGIGSGVILNANKGVIVTNSHLVTQARNIVVGLKDGRKFIGKLVGMDPLTDLAVVTIKPDHLSQIRIASHHRTKVGDYVTAIGNPFGLTQTVTQGIISGMHRHLGIEGIENFIQTDAPINPGNSGGALVNQHGELVGINTAILSKSGGNIGIGFAIPINMVIPVTNQLLKHGNVQRGIMGLMAQNMSPMLAKALKKTKTQGALINHIVKNSSADKAGLEIEDLIISLNGNSITNANELKSLAAVYRAGQFLTLQIERQGKIISKRVQLVGQPKETLTSKHIKNHILDGLTIENINRIQSNGEHINGVRVISILPGSVAWLGGLMPNDVILSINHHETPSMLKFMNFLRESKQTQLLLTVLRKNSRIFLVLQK